MTRAVERLVIFAFGAGLGCAGSGFFFKKQYDKIKKKFDKDLIELKEYYETRIRNPIERAVKTEPDDIDVELYKSSKPVDIAKTTSNKTEKAPKTDYQMFYNQSEVDELNGILAKNEEEDDEERKKKGLQVLDNPVDFGAIPYYSSYDISYYIEDGTLILETEEGDEKMLDEVADKILQKIDETGFGRNNVPTLWLMYPNRAAYYQVTKVAGSYSDP